MKHTDFRQDRRQAAVVETLDLIEGELLPSIVRMIAAAGADQRTDDRRATELRTLADDLARLVALVENPDGIRAQAGSPVSTDAK